MRSTLPDSMMRYSTRPNKVGGTSIYYYNDLMQRKTIPEKGPDEEEDLSPHQSGKLIACYADLSSSEEAQPSFDDSFEPRQRSPSLRSLKKSSKSSLSVQRNSGPQEGPYSRTDKNPKQ